MHPSIHLEIARQRHQDLLTEAERQRTAQTFDHAGGTPTARLTAQRANGSRTAFTEIAHDPDVEVGLEV